MEAFRESREIAAQFDRPVDDLRRLLAFHGLRSGLPQYVASFAHKLEESKPFRTDLTALLRSTRDLDRGRLTSDQMLAIVAVAVGGDRALDEPNASPETAHGLALVRMLLAGIGGWSDTGERAAVEPVRGAASPAVAHEASPAAKPRFAAAQADAAVDVRAFVRSDGRADLRSEEQAETVSGARPDSPTETRVEARSEAPHLRRELLSEIVRTPAVPDAAPRVGASTWTAPGAQRSSAQVGRAVASTAPETQLRAEPQTRPQSNARVEVQRHLTPKAAPEPQTRPEVAPVRSVSDTPPASSGGSEAARPVAAGERSAAFAADLGDIRQAEPDDSRESARRRPISRKVALDVLLGTAAVALLVFGVSEGVRSRHAAAPAIATAGNVPTTPAPTQRSPAPPSEGRNGSPEQPAAVATIPEAAATAAEPTPNEAPPAPAFHVAGQSSGSTEAAEPAPSRSAVAQPAAAPPLTRAAILATAPRGPVAVPEATMDRQLLATRKPVYPQAALAQNVDGTVVLRAFVSTDGTVRRTDVVTGPPLLVNSALAAASWRRYRPFLFHGRPVEVQTEITYHYVTP